MPTSLVATASIHVTAAAADSLQDHLDPANDAVVVVGVRETSDGDTTEDGVPGRPTADHAECDVADAATVARSRLTTVAPTIDLRDGDSLVELRAAIDEHDPGVVVIGANAGTAMAAGLGSTAQALLADFD